MDNQNLRAKKTEIIVNILFFCFLIFLIIIYLLWTMYVVIDSIVKLIKSALNGKAKIKRKTVKETVQSAEETRVDEEFQSSGNLIQKKIPTRKTRIERAIQTLENAKK